MVDTKIGSFYFLSFSFFIQLFFSSKNKIIRRTTTKKDQSNNFL